MIILGLNYYFHDSSACLVIDGKLVVALEEERFTRNKHTREFPERAVEECLRFAGISYADIDHIAVSIKPTHEWKKKAVYALKHLRHAAPFLKHELVGGFFKQRKLKSWIGEKFGAKQPPVAYVEHHQSHAAGSFLVSPYKEAAMLALDGSGEWACGWTGYGNGTTIECFDETYFPDSLGSFYEAVTEFCGFRPNYDEGKTMGLAPLGDPSVFYDRVAQIISFDESGRVKVDLSYFSYQYWGYRRCSEKFYEVFGQPRAKDAPFEKHHNDVAAAFQKVLEDVALKIARNLRERTGAKYLVIAGGVSLNSVMNGRLLREAGYEDVYIMPAAGDNGTSIGAAFYLYNVILGKPREFVHDNPYVGNAYEDEEIEALLKQYKLSYKRHDDITTETARLLNEGNIIGWFQGRMEIGPRALGARSILANPAIKDMKDKINAEVKYREAYRPFAPSSTVEAAGEFFDIDVEAPFMLKVCDVREDKRSVIPAVTHVDGSARLQTVRKETNPLYHALISKLGEHTGVPVVLNTSFNIQGEPVVESPRDAIRCFFSTGLDVLVIGSFTVHKRP
ncbi:carbamoyltransferase C-terminal domain-containing protein [Granulosicoccaceae sp. 1_MG-2023]|nr:carbamoyltransferase C-terminal domain-containing protein [Granulosicoccaceae sp. 1_MG-2023]